MSDNNQSATVLAKDIMTAETYAVTGDQTVENIITDLIQKRISGAPIVDSENKVISIVSEADLMKFAAAGGLKRNLSDFLDKLASSENVFKVTEDDSLKDILKYFLINPVRRAIVVDSSNTLQGIISRRDILRSLVESPETVGH